MESATHTQTEKKDKTLRRRSREPLMIGKRVLALTKWLKKKGTLHKRTYISSLQRTFHFSIVKKYLW